MRGNDQGTLEVVSESIEGIEVPRSRTHLALRCANVGIAHAKDVRIEWEYDILSLIALIAELDHDLGKSIFLEQPLLHFGGSSRRSVHMVDTQATARVVSIAPGPMASATRVSVPPAYMELLCTYFGAIVEALKRSKTAPEASPTKLELTVRYRDIGNNQHSRRFVVLPRFLSIKTGLSGGNETQALTEVEGYFDIQEA